MRKMEKLEAKIANNFIKGMQDGYGLTPRVETAIGFARAAINEYKHHVERERKIEAHQVLEDAYTKYYATTKLPEEDYKQHSAFYFKNFLYSHFTVILLKKGTLIDRFYWFVKKHSK